MEDKSSEHMRAPISTDVTIMYVNIVAGSCPAVESVEAVAQGIKFQMRASSVTVYYDYRGHATHVFVPISVVGGSSVNIDEAALLTRGRNMQPDFISVSVIENADLQARYDNTGDYYYYDSWTYTMWSFIFVFALAAALATF